MARPPLSTEGRRAWVARETADYPGSMTRTQLRVLLGWSESTMDRAVKRGRIEPGSIRSRSGWPLWSADQVKSILAKRIDGTL